MATYSSILAWRIPWTEETGGIQSMGSLSLSPEYTEFFWFLHPSVIFLIFLFFYFPIFLFPSFLFF